MTATIIMAASVAILKGDRFLLVERGRPPSKGLLAFPGGRVEPGETPEDAARRELYEETRLKTGDLSLFDIMDLPGSEQPDGPVYRLHVFLGRSAEGEAIAGDDAVSLGWYGLDEMRALAVTRSTLEAAEAMRQLPDTA